MRRYLIHREIDNDGVYEETIRPIHLDDGRTVPALVYLADRAHRQFAGKLPLAKAVALVAPRTRRHRQQPHYVKNMVAHLTEMGLRDRQLEEPGAPGYPRSAPPLSTARATNASSSRACSTDRPSRSLYRPARSASARASAFRCARAVGGQRRQFMLEPAGQLHAVGGVHPA